jgi:hypothetical protein
MGNATTSSTERSRVIERADASSSLDAAYIIADFNRRCRMLREEPITLEEVVSGAGPREAEILKRQANGLHADEGYFGEKHWTGRDHEEIYKEMRDRHPGFGQVSYELALHRGIIAMR